MNLTHHGELLRCFQHPHAPQYGGAWGVTGPHDWALNVCKEIKFTAPVGHTALDRATLRQLLTIQTSNLARACLVLAWGEMRPRNAKYLLLSTDKKSLRCNPAWLQVTDALWGGQISAIEAYEEFRKIRMRGEQKGLGPAYFTKLIFFLDRGRYRRGYILDQWLARSMNLIFDAHPIILTKPSKNGGRFVADINDSSAYQRFNERIEALAQHWGTLGHVVDGEQVEMALFDRGRPRQGMWRTHVRIHG